MFNPLLSDHIRERRLSLGLTQRRAAALVGMSAARLSDLEIGRRRPNQKETQRLIGTLGVKPGFVPPENAYKLLLEAGARKSPPSAPFFGSQDRPTFVRYRASCRRDPVLVERLVGIIMRRDDCRICEFFCHKVPCDSTLEVIYLLRLLALGATPAFVAPASLARVPHEVTDDRGRVPVGLKPRPCIVWQERFYFFQVSFRLSQTYRVDILCWDGDQWSIIELDGTGHDSFFDSQRDTELGIPTTRISRREVYQLAQQTILERAA